MRKNLLVGIVVMLAYIAAGYFAQYSRVELAPLIQFPAFGLTLASLWYRSKQGRLNKLDIVLFAIFSFLFAGAFVLGYHLEIGEDTYSGTLEDHYISEYGPIDILAFASVFFVTYANATALFVLLKSKKLRHLLKKATDRASINLGPLPKKIVAITCLALFLLWIPYLITYWPGFIANDSLSSINQALGLQGYSNHHPLAFTLLVKCCLFISSHLGFGNTVGCALFSVCQMMAMTFVFGYLFTWIVTRCNISRLWVLPLIAIFGLTPYIATYSIVMWKDPLFSVGIAFVTCLLLDFALTKGAIVRTSKFWLPGFVIGLLAMSFLRNNGVYISALLLLVAVALWVTNKARHRQWDSKGLNALCVSVASVLILFSVVTGPLYQAKGVASSPKAESYGVLINQMARTAAYDGNLDDSDKNYLDSLFPLERYKEAYRPCCTDLLKWDPEFNSEALNDDFFSHWLSIFVKNPRIYFESWELQTFGFWAVNVPISNNYAFGNISSGMPQNVNGEYALAGLDIYFPSFLEGGVAHQLFPMDSQSLPVSWINWGLIYLTLCLILSKKPSWILSLVPSLGLAATLVIASPIWYWPRYGAAEQFLIPFYLGIVVLLIKSNGTDQQTDRTK